MYFKFKYTILGIGVGGVGEGGFKWKHEKDIEI